MGLHVTDHCGSGPTVIALHGFTQTEVSWAPLLDELGPTHNLVTVDLPGHGGSSAQRGDLTATAAMVRDAIGARLVTLVGYSMGARVALRLALDYPQALTGLVLIGATAGIDDPLQREQRLASDHELANAIERDGVEVFLGRWLAQPLFAGLEVRAEDLTARRVNSATGLANSLRDGGTATMDPPWWPELASLRVPTLIMWGQRDTKFAAIGDRLARSIGPAATTAEIAGAGHSAHLEQPAQVAELIRRFVKR